MAEQRAETVAGLRAYSCKLACLLHLRFTPCCAACAGWAAAADCCAAGVQLPCRPLGHHLLLRAGQQQGYPGCAVQHCMHDAAVPRGGLARQEQLGLQCQVSSQLGESLHRAQHFTVGDFVCNAGGVATMNMAMSAAPCGLAGVHAVFFCLYL